LDTGKLCYSLKALDPDLITCKSCNGHQSIPQDRDSLSTLIVNQESLRSLYSQAFHCQWTGCKARTKSFLLPTDLDHHIQTYHLHHCPWPTCHVLKSFRRRSDLTRHLLSVHSGIRKHRCHFPGCGKAFARSDKLTAHVRIHQRASASPDANPSSSPLSSLPAGMVETSPLEYPCPSSCFNTGTSLLDFGLMDRTALSESGFGTSSPTNGDRQSDSTPHPSLELFVEEPTDIAEKPTLQPEQDAISPPQVNQLPLPSCLLPTNDPNSAGLPGSIFKEAIIPMCTQRHLVPWCYTCQPDMWPQSMKQGSSPAASSLSSPNL
jgi:hypothetical protein